MTPVDIACVIAKANRRDDNDQNNQPDWHHSSSLSFVIKQVKNKIARLAPTKYVIEQIPAV
jgi:hypothetical protein